MKLLFLFSVLLLCGCSRGERDDNDLVTYPITNSPTVVPYHQENFVPNVIR